MTLRTALVVAAAILIAACGGGSDEAGISVPDITLITTTTEPPVFEAGDGQADPVDNEEADTAPIDSVPTTEPTAPSVTPAPAEVAAPTTTTTTEPEPATTQPPAGGSFVLGADGLGAVQFGADPEGTITFVSSMLGAPTLDTGWVPPFDIGPCGGTRIRQVSWNDLLLEFGDVSDITEGRDHLYAYFYGRVGSSSAAPTGFATAENIGIGSSVAALLAAYPAVEFRQGDDFIEPNFSISNNLFGLLSGLADDDVIEVFIGGLPCNG